MEKSYIKTLVQQVLDKEFKSTEKRRIREYADRLNYACPVCGDSDDDRKKRGNLYFNRLFHVCFNCGAKMTIDRLCRRFDQPIDPSAKLEMIEYLNSQVTVSDYHDNVEDFDMSSLIGMADLTAALSSGENGISDFAPVSPGGLVGSYLAERMIAGPLLSNIYQAKYWYDDARYENVICLLNRRGDRVMSMQIRNLKGGKRRMFKVYNFEALHKWVTGRPDADDLDVGRLVLLNKLSYYFNILNVDFSRDLTVFEGYLDSLFMPNSIGVIGVNTSMSFLESNTGLSLRYFFDNDPAGHRKTEEKLRQGHRVFLWRKLFDYVVSQKQGADPYRLMHRISKVKDLNDLCKLAGQSLPKLRLDDHFSRDQFDLQYVPRRARPMARAR